MSAVAVDTLCDNHPYLVADLKQAVGKDMSLVVQYGEYLSTCRLPHIHTYTHTHIHTRHTHTHTNAHTSTRARTHAPLQ